MPACLFCKREDLPRVPLLPLAANAITAHVNASGQPCLEGASPETHANMLGAEYPHVELLSDDEAWSDAAPSEVTAAPPIPVAPAPLPVMDDDGPDPPPGAALPAGTMPARRRGRPRKSP